MFEKFKRYITKERMLIGILTIATAFALGQNYVTNQELASVVRPTRTPKQTTTTTLTPLPSITSTPVITPPVLTCPPHANMWHEPQDVACMHHHHGVNPLDYVEVFSDGGFDLDSYLNEVGVLYQPAWLSNINEEVIGMIWLYGHTNTCLLFNNGGQLKTDEYGCITDFLFRIHDVGTADHLVNRFHSFTVIVRACNQLSNNQYGTACGVMAVGGLTDYGILETPYKNQHCPLANDPTGFVDLNQPPYRTLQTQDRGDLVSYWNGLKPNAIQAEFYPHNPNSIVGFAWNSTDAYHIWDYALGCNQPTVEQAKANAMNFTKTSYLHANFNVFEVITYPIPESPYTGYVDQYGHIRPEGECQGTSLECIPLIVTGEFPLQALWNKQVNNQVKGPYDFSNPLLLPPWLDGH